MKGINKDCDDKLFFCISLKSQANSLDWPKVCEHLDRTLNSIYASTSNDHVIIAGHEKPNIEAIQSPYVTFLEAPFEPPSAKGKGRPFDKARKRRLAGAWVRKHIRQQVRLAFIDADDLVANTLVEFAKQSAPETSIIIDAGYRLDLQNGDLERIDTRFYRHCGSCFLPVFSRDELPQRWEDESTLFSNFGPHPNLVNRMNELGRPLVKISEPSVVYLMNHTDSLEYAKKGMKNGLVKNQYSWQEREDIFSNHFACSFSSLIS